MNLQEIRAQIDAIDDNIIEQLAKRFRLTGEVAQLKKTQGLGAVDKNRENEMLERVRGVARSNDLDPDVATRIMQFIIDEVVKRHRQIIDD